MWVPNLSRKETSFGFTQDENKEKADYSKMKSKLQDELKLLNQSF